MKKYFKGLLIYVVYVSVIHILCKGKYDDHYCGLVFFYITIPCITLLLYYHISKRRKIKNMDFNCTSVLFVKKYSFIDFVQKYGPKVQLGRFTNSNNINYYICAFIQNNGSITYVKVDSSLNIHTPEDILSKKENLIIGKLPSGELWLSQEGVNIWKDIYL